METTNVNRENITKHLVEKELEMVGKTMLDTLDVEDWWFEFTMTRAQYEEFVSYSIKLIKKIFKVNTTKAHDIFKWYYKAFGLRIKG
jgi:hypothetical protein